MRIRPPVEPDRPRERQRVHERLRALAHLDLRGDPETELGVLLGEVVQAATTLLPADGGASVVLWDALSESFEQSASTVAGQRPGTSRKRLRRRRGATRWIVDHARPLVVADVADDPFGANPLLVEHGLHAYLGLPLLYGGEVHGVLYAMWRAPHAVPDEDRVFLELLASKAAQAIAHVRMLGRLQRTLRETDMMRRVSSALSNVADLAQALEQLVEEVAEAFEVPRTLLLILDHDAAAVRHFLTSGVLSADMVEHPYREYMEGLTGHVVRSGEATLSVAADADPRESPRDRSRRNRHRAGSLMVAPLAIEGDVFGTLTVIRNADQPPFAERDLMVLAAIAAQASLAINRARLFERVVELATLDELTGVPNRRRLFEAGADALTRAQRNRRPLAGLMLDIDGFKQVNDRYGHGVGDEVLRELAQRLGTALRTVDVFGRYGGEEFAALLPETDGDAAREIAERLRRVVADAPFPTGAGALDITISLGVATADLDRDDPAALLDRADAALYAAKRGGRNRVAG